MSAVNAELNSGFALGDGSLAVNYAHRLLPYSR